jgi:hypothetical protein
MYYPHCYAIVTAAFAEQNQHYERCGQRLLIRITNDGLKVVSLNEINIFPELFQDMPLKKKWLYPDAFPLTED